MTTSMTENQHLVPLGEVRQIVPTRGGEKLKIEWVTQGSTNQPQSGILAIRFRDYSGNVVRSARLSHSPDLGNFLPIETQGTEPVHRVITTESPLRSRSVEIQGCFVGDNHQILISQFISVASPTCSGSGSALGAGIFSGLPVSFFRTRFNIPLGSEWGRVTFYPVPTTKKLNQFINFRFLDQHQQPLGDRIQLRLKADTETSKFVTRKLYVPDQAQYLTAIGVERSDEQVTLAGPPGIQWNRQIPTLTSH